MQDRMGDVDAAIVRFLHAPSDDFDAVQALHAELASLIAKDASALDAPYGDYFDAVRALLDGRDGASAVLPDALASYRFVVAFSFGSYLGRRRAEAQRHLLLRHEEHLALIDRALETPDRVLCEASPPIRDAS